MSIFLSPMFRDSEFYTTEQMWYLQRNVSTALFAGHTTCFEAGNREELCEIYDFRFVERIDSTANLESNAHPEPVRAPPLDDTVQEIPALLINGQGDVVQSNQPEPPQPQINYGEKLVSKVANSREIDDPTCAICLIDYDFKDRMSIMSLQTPSKVSQLKCGHWFHYQCIKEWFQHKNANECPVCRGIAV